LLLLFWNFCNSKQVHLKNDEIIINAWKNGETKSDFVNANMIELKNTGFMSNRGRQNVASYFCKTLQLDYSLKTLWIEIVEMANLATLVQNGLVKVAF
jgi:deoxyribodipyrimidine photo-lyase